MKKGNIKSFSYTKYEDNRPTEWKVVLGNISGTEVDRFDPTYEMEVTDETTLLFKGPVKYVSYDTSTRDLELSGGGVELLLAKYFTQFHPLTDESGVLLFENGTISAILTELLRGTDITLGTCDSIFTGTSTQNTFRFEHISRLDAIKQVADTYGAKFWITDDRKLYFSMNRGTATGKWFRCRPDDTSSNIRVLKKTVDYTKLVNTLEVLGNATGRYQLRGTAYSSDYADLYGIYEGSESKPEIVTQDVLDEYATNLVKILAPPIISIELTVPFDKTLNPGDTIKVTDEVSNINETFKIIQISVNKSSDGNITMNLSLSNNVGKFNRDFLELWTRLKILERTTLGSQMIIPFINILTGTSLTVNIYIPEDVVQAGILNIDKVIVDFIIASGTASLYVDGTAVTTALGGPWTSSQSGLLITNYVATIGLHTVELRNTTSNTMKMVVQLYASGRGV